VERKVTTSGKKVSGPPSGRTFGGAGGKGVRVSVLRMVFKRVCGKISGGEADPGEGKGRGLTGRWKKILAE